MNAGHCLLHMEIQGALLLLLKFHHLTVGSFLRIQSAAAFQHIHPWAKPSETTCCPQDSPYLPVWVIRLTLYPTHQTQCKHRCSKGNNRGDNKRHSATTPLQKWSKSSQDKRLQMKQKLREHSDTHFTTSDLGIPSLREFTHF